MNVRVELTKWGERPHWEFDAVLLGNDEHGDWIGVPAGTPMLRPGAAFTPPVDSVVLVPSGAPWWLATFYAPGFRVEVYVDITAPASWDGPVLRAVDLDLDVVRGETGRVWVDDEDEFAEHRVQLGYPDDVVRAASQSCAAVHAMIRDRVAPFDGVTPEPWLSMLGD